MRQARSEARKQAKIKRQEKAVELQMALEDRAAARSVQQELAELHRGSIRWAARFKVQVEPDRPQTRTSPVTKRVISRSIRAVPRGIDTALPASSWVTDAMGMKGVIWQQSYVGRKSPRFYRGVARDNWQYDVRDEAVLLGADGEPVIISNMGDDWVEIGAAWQAVEDASTRANAKIQIRCIAPFDSDMSEAEMIAALTHFCTTVLGPLDLPYSAVIHRPPAHGDARNFHPHLAFSLRPTRRVEPYCWDIADEVCGELDGRDGVQMLRHMWAHSMSTAAEQAGSNRRYTGLGYGARRLDLEAGEHLGEGRSAIVARGGDVRAERRNQIKNARNAARRAIRDADQKIAALTAVRDAALKRLEPDVERTVPERVVRAALPVEPAAVRSSAGSRLPTVALTATKPHAPAVIVESIQTDVTTRQSEMVPAAAAHAATTLTSSEANSATASVSTPANSVSPASWSHSGRKIVQASFLRAGKPSVSAEVLETAHRPRVAGPPAALVTPVVSAQLRAGSRRPRPSVEIVPAKRTPAPPGADQTVRLLDTLAAVRRARLRRRRRDTTTAGRGLDTMPTLDTIPLLVAVPALAQLAADAGSRPPADAAVLDAEDRARIARLATIDAYVADYRGPERQVEIDYPALKAIGVGWDWLNAAGVQQALRALRADQQQVVAELAREAAARPLAFAKHGTRFWPRDLSADLVRRLDRWATDPGFQRDVFEMGQAIAKAHDADDASRREARVTHRTVGANLAAPVPDGFGGWRQESAPVFRDESVYAHVAAFDPVGGQPSDPLLLLLLLAGRHPRQIVFADDGRLMALPGPPALLAPLLHPWRQDERVAALVAETVRASREAGAPTWPRPVANAVQAFAARTGDPSAANVRPPPDLARGPTR
ncbi:hypothetical protein [Sphingomonas sp. Leaf25]|uniref:hypothetical protein n=1 Tax=Sphingomonas sp. Leaf25 TaxID=1735692 RepID=UPI0006F7E43F|nr:hypothetical protein [Sphingomonas sp. Leaf25]KQM99375.1 hypothetical protein ASE78_17835 [Sphingomonas sp. Leaf25]